MKSTEHYEVRLIQRTGEIQRVIKSVEQRQLGADLVWISHLAPANRRRNFQPPALPSQIPDEALHELFGFACVAEVEAFLRWKDQQGTKQPSTTLGQMLRQARKTQKLSLRKTVPHIFGKEGTPISPQYLHRVEQDQEIPSVHVLQQLAQVLQTDVVTLFTHSKKAETLLRTYLLAYPMCETAVIRFLLCVQQHRFTDWDALTKQSLLQNVLPTTTPRGTFSSPPPLRRHPSKPQKISRTNMAEEPQALVGKIIGHSPAMSRIAETIRTVAPMPATVLITGETGVGKELVAQALHHQSPRRAGPFIPVNCAALPESLLASELFGHERGAFTGAIRRHIGKFEQADGGTLFLDEVGSLPFSAQATLLRVLEERAFQRVGGERTVHVDVRVIAAANQNLRQMVTTQMFREDLFHRLYIIPIEVPALREHPEDIPLLAQHFLHRYTVAYNRQVDGFTAQGLSVLCAYGWPGNVRELEHIIERLVVTTPSPMLNMEIIRTALKI